MICQNRVLTVLIFGREYKKTFLQLEKNFFLTLLILKTQLLKIVIRKCMKNFSILVPFTSIDQRIFVVFLKFRNICQKFAIFPHQKKKGYEYLLFSWRPDFFYFSCILRFRQNIAKITKIIPAKLICFHRYVCFSFLRYVFFSIFGFGKVCFLLFLCFLMLAAASTLI